MTTPTQNQGKSTQDQQNQQNQQNQAQGRKDDMHNTGAQAKRNETASQDAERDVQQRKDAPKQDQDR